MAFTKLLTLADLPPNEMRMIEYDGAQIAVYNCGGALYATTNVCTHAYAELHEASSTPRNARSSARCTVRSLASRPARCWCCPHLHRS